MTRAASSSCPSSPLSDPRSSLSVDFFYCFSCSYCCAVIFLLWRQGRLNVVKEAATLSRASESLQAREKMMVIVMRLYVRRKCSLMFSKTYRRVDASLEPAAVCVVYQIYYCPWFVNSVETQALLCCPPCSIFNSSFFHFISGFLLLFKWWS